MQMDWASCSSSTCSRKCCKGMQEYNRHDKSRTPLPEFLVISIPIMKNWPQHSRVTREWRKVQQWRWLCGMLCALFSPPSSSSFSVEMWKLVQKVPARSQNFSGWLHSVATVAENPRPHFLAQLQSLGWGFVCFVVWLNPWWLSELGLEFVVAVDRQVAKCWSALRTSLVGLKMICWSNYW